MDSNGFQWIPMDSNKLRNYLFFHNFLYNKGAFKMQDKSRRLIAIPCRVKPRSTTKKQVVL